MKNTVKWSSLALAVAMGNGLVATQAAAQGEGFVEGANATLSNRTMYFNRDFRSNTGGQSKAEEAATGFLLNFQSGFTEGPIGLGADVLATAGFKIDSGRGRTGTDLLPQKSNGKAPAEYSQIRGALKASIVEDTILRYGAHLTHNPVIAYDDTRLLPSHYSGYSVTNQSIDGLFVEAGRMTHRSDMNSSSEDKGAFDTVNEKRVDYLGGTYAFADNLSASLYTSKADDLWKRHYAGVTHTADLNGDLSLTSDVNFYKTSNDNNAVDYGNKAGSLAFTLGAGFHDFTVAYQRMSGKNGFEYVDDAIYLANSVQTVDFNAQDERSWQARYDYDFAGAGIPGLTFMTRYVRGSNISSDASARSTRWERDTDIGYQFQSGFLQGIDLVWRNATVRQDSGLDGGDIDENRVIASYTWNLL